MQPSLKEQYLAQRAGQQRGNMGLIGGIIRPTAGGTPPPTTKTVQSGGNFFNYAGRVASQAAGIIGQGVAQAASFVANTPKYIYQGVEPFLRPVADVLTGSTSRDLANINKLSAQLDENARRYNEAYRSGKMSEEHYKNLRLELYRAYRDLSKRAEGVASFAKEQGDPKRVLKGAAETAATILSGGRWVALKGGKPVAQSVVAQNINKVAGKFETALERIPAFRELVARNLDKIATQNAKRLAGETTAQFMARNSKDLAIGLLLKRPIIYQTNIGEAEDIYTGMAMGDYGEVFSSTGWIASQMIGGGPIGWFVRHGKKAGIKLRELSRGRGSLLDEISKRIGNGNPAQAARYLNTLQEKAPETFKKHEEVARIMQETNLRVANERVADAAENILSTYDQAGIARENISFGMILRDYQRWAEAADIVDSLKGRKIPGLDEYQVNNLVVIRWDSIMKRGLAEGIQQAGNDKQAMVAVLNEFAQRTANGWGNNPNLMRQLTRIIDESASAEEAARRIKAIPTATAMPDGLPKSVANRLAKLGYGVAVPMGGVRKTPVVKLEDTRKLVTGAIRGTRTITIRNPALKGVPKPVIEAAKRAKTFDEFVDSQSVFHGSPLKIDRLSVEHANPMESTLNRGIYTTTDRTIAESYAKNRNGAIGTLFSFEKPTGAKVFDFTTNESAEKLGINVPERYKDKAAFNAYMNRKWGSEGIDYSDLLPASRENYIFDQLVIKALKESGDTHAASTWSDIKNTPIRELAQTDEVLEIHNKVNDMLRRNGFSVVKHQGGIRAAKGSKLHDVYIALDDDALQPVDRAKLRRVYDAAKNPTVTRTIASEYDEAIEPHPALRAIAGALDKMGLSPQGVNQVANQSLRQSLAASLSETEIGRVLGIADHNGDVTKGAAAILSRLQKYVETKKPIWVLGKLSSGKSAVTDVRMLRVGEIAEALGVSKTQAKEVQRALIDAYIKVPRELRGLGDRIVDYDFKFNPAQKYYARIQSALRYTYNPFFRLQEQVETAVLARMNADKFLWLQPREKLNEAVQKLTSAGFFDGNLTSAASDDVVFGRISANLTKFQKRNLAGLALTLADRKGITLDDMIRNYPDELDDALRVIVQYPNKGVLTSALARTLNVAFFPMRYNAKVTMLAAQKIAELPPSVQLGVIQGFMKLNEWLKSDEGIRWQAEHADAIKVFQWVTPVGSIQQFYKVATGNVEAPGDLGLLGGLPFGMISQILDSQGLINLNTPYVDPATGDQFPDYIPQTTRARAAVAINDLLGTMFSFPGRTLGLPGKEATLREIVDLYIDTNGSDFDKRLDPNLTPLQKKWIEVLKGDTSEETVNELYMSPADGQFNYYTIPPFDLPIVRPPTTPIKPPERRTGLPSKSGNGKIRPQPIPIR